MYIEKLEIDNFKSFAENMTIPFLKGFTTITGPNGSGKSNIIDSILFALGLASARNLRTEQLYDFISTFTKKNEAFVKVFFAPDNENEHSFSVARKIKKSSQGFNSIYYLNDKVSTLTDIHAELEKYHITPNSYNVIMQGDVTGIIKCSLVERRKIIDEIAGVSEFNRNIEKAQSELDTVEQRVSNANLILGEIDERVSALAKEREIALKYRELKENKTKLEAQVSTVRYFDLKKSIQQAHENILEFNKKKKEAESDFKTICENLTKVKSKHDDISTLVKTNGEEEQIETKKKAEEIKGQIASKQQAFNFAEKNIHDNLKTIENSKNGIENYKKQIEKIKFQISQKNDEISEIKKNIELQRKELDIKIEETMGLNKDADKQMAEREELRKSLETLKDREFSIRTKSIPLETELTASKKDFDTAQYKLAELKEFEENFSGEKDKLEIEVKNLEHELSDLKLAQQNILQNLDTNKCEISDTIYNVQLAQKKIMTIQAQKAAFEAVNAGDAVEALMRSGIKGVHSPLYKLGKVNEQYSLALEVAMGGRMRNVIVEDEFVAGRCIDFLKSSRAGLATFLPLNKMKKAPSKLGLPRDKGVIDYAINLVDFDDEYIDAFYYALGDTLIVEDSECSHKLIGKYRTVTLDGRLFEKSGAITGGDRKKSGIKFATNQDDELDICQKRFNELKNKQEELENHKQELEDKQEKIRQLYSDSLNALNTAKFDLKNLIDKEENNKELISQNENTVKELQPKIKKLETELEKYEENLVQVSNEILIIQDKIQKIDDTFSSEELKKLKELTTAIEKQISEYETKIIHCEGEINNHQTSINFNSDLIETKDNQIKSLNFDNKKYEEDKKQYLSEIENLQFRLSELEEKIAGLGEKLKELQAQRDLVQEELLKLETDKTNKNNEIERIAEQVESFKTRRNELEPLLKEARELLAANDINIETLVPAEISIDELNSKIQKLQKKMEDMEPVNMLAIDTYAEVKARQESLKSQVETLTNEKNQILQKMTGYEQAKKETFMKTYEAINKNFVSVFSKLAEGEGTLLLEDEQNPFNGGLTIKAQLRDKQKQKLNALSGGEKSLTALAFVFAIQQYMPAPFYALDEVDANLDGLNVERLAEIITEQAKDTQFVVVSHRKPMIQSASRTIGVTQKEKGKTKVTGIKHRD